MVMAMEHDRHACLDKQLVNRLAQPGLRSSNAYLPANPRPSPLEQAGGGNSAPRRVVDTAYEVMNEDEV